MSGHKRSISNVDDTLEVPPKVVKTNDLDDASTRAQDLEAQIAELQDFIVAKGLHLGVHILPNRVSTLNLPFLL